MSDEKAEKEIHDPITEAYSLKWPSVKITSTEYDCPICGVITSVIIVSFGDPTLDGYYCQVCWVRRLKESVPKVTKRGGDESRSKNKGWGSPVDHPSGDLDNRTPKVCPMCDATICLHAKYDYPK